jgi:uncharacterized protein YjeT (DUF2065 family)
VVIATRRTGQAARIALGVVRLLNGSLALFAPDVLGRRLGVQTSTSPGLGYGLRLFGVRTVLLGLRLLRAHDQPGTPVVREALVVHTADTAAAAVVLARGELPATGARLAVAASAINIMLAVIANLPTEADT